MTIITLVCIVIGIWVLLARFFHNSKVLTLLETGTKGKAELTDMQQLPSDGENSTIQYSCTFKFMTESKGEQTFEITTSDVDDITDDDEEDILYLESNPDVAHLMDNLPAKVSIGEDNIIRPKGSLSSGVKPILPIVAIAYMLVQFLNIF